MRKTVCPPRSADTWPGTRFAWRSTAACQAVRTDARRRTPCLPSSSPAAAAPLRRPFAKFAPLRLVERPFRPRQGFRLAQHFEAHGAGQRRHFDEANLDAIGELESLAGALSEQRPGRLVEQIIIVAES